MAANRMYLEKLLEINMFYGGGNTVEQCITLAKYEGLCDREWDFYKDEQSYRIIPDAFNDGNRCDDERFNPDVMDQELINAGVYPPYDECGVRDDVLDAFGV